MAGGLAIGQIVHSGHWDPNPSALPRLLRFVQNNSTIAVEFQRQDLAPESKEIFKFPLLYMVGHNDFQFSENQVANLRAYLRSGGVLLGEACCGSRQFDRAFRREIKRVLPEHSLEVLSAEHLLFDVNFSISSVRVTPLAEKLYPGLDRPKIEAISINDDLAVIYSPLALANGWEDLPHRFSAGYLGPDALKLGTNIIAYIMSH